MNLYILRHADAEPLGFNGIKKDANRPLTDYGRKQAKKVGQALEKLDIELNHILTSPYDRAKQTAEIVADELKILDVDETDTLLPAASSVKLVDVLKTFKADSSILLVGHQPDLGELISYFVWGEDSIEVPLKKAGMANIEIINFSNCVGQSALNWLLTYDQLAMLLK
jgi:phosphohistidine phosphatase